ncbi:MAG: CCA tRNA nucleotidyltransferase, partial [Nitrospirales bacterium]|nr:CCA tRNA nucleotidyltransferase [Nitrospirales bacterium]
MTELIDLFRSFINRQGLPLRTFLVGGAVRDLLLGIETKDADIALDGDSLATAEAFSREAGATFVLLDREWRTGRVVRGKEQIDISPLRGGSIEADLSERDLTINAMAIPLSKTTQGAIIDPFGGRRDLEDRLIRMVSEKNLRKDPLRVLRVYRFSATLSFSIEAETRAAAIRCSPLIASVARERIAEEMRHIFRTSPSAPTVQRLIEDRILHSVLPEMKDLGEASWLLYKEAEALLENPEELLGTLDKEIVRYKGDIQRLTCFRISLLPADRATAGMLCRGMKLSGRETTLIQKMVSLRERLTALYPYRERGIENPETIDFLQAAEEDLLGLTIFFSAF